MSELIRSFHPLRNTGTAMQPNTLLIAKLLIVLLFIEKFPSYLHEPFLPFFDAMTALGEIPGYPRLLKAAFLGGSLLVLCNQQVRPACVMLGLLVIIANVQSQVEFRNHIVLCGCALLLAGLQPAGQEPWLIRWQMVVVYLGAWLNKQLDPDWLNGKFFEFWTHTNMQHGPYIALAAMFPNGWLSIFMSWVTILSEFFVMLGLCFRRWWAAALWLGILFHLATFVFTLGNTFGHFIQSLAVVYLAFLTWPKTQGTVSMPGGFLSPFAKLLRVLDTDRVWHWQQKSSEKTLRAERDGKVMSGMEAVRAILFHSTGFYWAAFIAFEICTHLLVWPASFIPSLALILVCIIPFAWPATSFFKKRDGQT